MGRTGDSLHFEFPPRSGGGSPLREELLVGRKRDGPRVRWLLLNVNVTLIIIAEPDGPRRVTLAWRFSYILQKVFVKAKQNDEVPSGVFCCRDPFFVLLV